MIKSIKEAQHISFIEADKAMPFMSLPIRSTSVSVSGGRVLISPGSMMSRDDLKATGEITDIVAPNLFHCSGIPGAIVAFPRARVWATENVRKAKPLIRWTDELTPMRWLYQEELPVFEISGMPRVEESVFLDRRSNSLIVTDLLFNIKNPKGLGARIILGLFGTFNRLAISKFYAKLVSDKVAFEASMHEILRNDFDNIILSHGSVVFGQGNAQLKSALLDRGFEC